MQREIISPRDNWKQIVESQGLTFHSRDGDYWNESACYRFTDSEITRFERAANRLHELCLEAAQHIVDKDLFHKLAIPENARQLIINSWNSDELHLYGRFDFCYDGFGEPKMLEYNADTPTSLLEASVIQWYFLQDRYPQKDQFNSLHEKLIARWQELGLEGRVHFTTLDSAEEDVITTEYLRDTASQSGHETQYIGLSDIGYNPQSRTFRDLEERDIKNLFKLYPWEWVTREEFGVHVQESGTRVIEPAWKMLWSNKGILPILWDLHPNHPNLLPAYFEKGKLGSQFVRKPLLGREGANVMIYDYGKTTETQGDYGEEGYVYQKYFPPRFFDGKNPVLGLWMIGDECCGMGIRESDKGITDNTSQFVPHYIG